MKALSIVSVVTVLLAVPSVGFTQASTELNCDSNGQGGRDLSDAVYLFTWLFLGGPEPVEYRPGGAPSTFLLNGNCNGDLKRDLADGIYILNWLFLGGPQPVLDSDVDQVFDHRDNCPNVANSNQADADGDKLGDACDNCINTSNADQKDSDLDGIGDACEVQITTYQGSLTATGGRWTYVGRLGMAGANAACGTSFPNSKVCTFDQLRKAASAGELRGAVDTMGNAVNSFWANNPESAGNRQCVDTSRENIPWTYQTGHIAIDGEYVTLDSVNGTLGASTLQPHCNVVHWVACCK